jgi:carnitine O-acetyltransferase
VPVYDEDGKVLNQRQITSQLEKVVSQSPHPSADPIGILTTENRTTWSKARDILIKGILYLLNL